MRDEIICKLMNYLLLKLGYDEIQELCDLTDVELKFCKDIVEDEQDDCDRFEVGDKVRYTGEPNGISYPKTGSIGVVERCDRDGCPLVRWSPTSNVIYNVHEAGFRWHVSQDYLIKLED